MRVNTDRPQMAMVAEHAYGGVVWVPKRNASVKPTEGLDETPKTYESIAAML